MPVVFEVKAVKVSGSLRMTIPKEIAKALEIQQGDTLLVSLNDSTMMVRKKTT